MKNFDLNAFGVEAMPKQEMQMSNGGFVAITILGIAFTAKAVAGMCFAALGVGVAVGAAAASN